MNEYELFLSIGSPKIKADAQAEGPVTVHLGSINAVVIVEGRTAGSTGDSHLLNAYNAKYDWDYTVDGYGPFTLVGPAKVIAWRSPDGREGTGFKRPAAGRSRPNPTERCDSAAPERRRSGPAATDPIGTSRRRIAGELWNVRLPTG